MKNVIKYKDELLKLKNIVFEASITANSIADNNGIIIHANEEFLKLWRYGSLKEVIGKPISHFFKYKHEASNIVFALNKTGKWKGEYTGLKNDGSDFTAYGLATVVENEKGEKIGYQSAVLDITKSKQWENALKESEKNFRLLFENSPFGTYTAKPDGVIIDANKKLLSFLGSPSLEATKQINVIKFPPLVKNGYAKKFLQCVKTGQTEKMEILYKSKWNKEVFLSSYIIPLKDENGEVVRIYTIMEDITERKSAEKKLQESKETYLNLFHNAQVGLFRTRIKDGKILESNNQLANMFGFNNREEFINNYFTSKNYVDAGTREKMIELLTKNGEIRNFESRFYRKDGTIFWASFSARIYTNKGWIEGVATDITKRKINEEKIKQFSNIFFSSLNEVYLFDVKTYKFLQANNVVFKNLGFTSDELLMLTPFDIEPEYNKELYDKLVKPLINNEKKKIVFETVHQRKDRSLYNVEVHLQLLKYEDKTVFAAFVLDITERKTFEQALKDNEAKFRILAENTYDWEYWLTPGGNFLYVSPACERISGYKSSELISDRNLIYQIVHPDYREKMKTHFQTERNEKTKLFKAEFPIITKKGEIRWIEHTCKPVYNDKGEFRGRRGNNHDITERKQRESENENLLFKNIQQLKELTCLNGLANSINKRDKIEEIFNDLLSLIPFAWNNSNYIKVRIIFDGKEYKSKKFKETEWKQIADIIVNKKKRGTVEVFRTKQIEKIGKDIFSTEEINLLENITRTLSEAIKSKENEKELNEYRIQLEKKVQDRTKELERKNKSLVESQKAMSFLIEDANSISEQLKANLINLANINKELESFSYSVSHDLRAPLTRMYGFSEALLNLYGDKLDEKGKHYLNRIMASSKKMSALIEDILRLSRITSHKILTQNVNISIIAHQIIDDLASDNPDRIVDIIIKPGIKVVCDSHLIKILLQNIISNAWKFTSKKTKAEIEIGIKQIRNKEVIFIKDNGAGFDMNYHDELFKPFNRFHSDVDFKGTGIGLAIVQRIINKHNGKIWAESQIGKGATFYFYV